MLHLLRSFNFIDWHFSVQVWKIRQGHIFNWRGVPPTVLIEPVHCFTSFLLLFWVCLASWILSPSARHRSCWCYRNWRFWCWHFLCGLMTHGIHHVRIDSFTQKNCLPSHFFGYFLCVVFSNVLPYIWNAYPDCITFVAHKCIFLFFVASILVAAYEPNSIEIFATFVAFYIHAKVHVIYQFYLAGKSFIPQRTSLAFMLLIHMLIQATVSGKVSLTPQSESAASLLFFVT